MVFAEKQRFKGVYNYFTDSLLYKEAADVPLPDEPDSGNEADSELENDTPVTFVSELIVAYLGDSTCKNDTVENDNEWVLNEDVSFDYSYCLNVPETTYLNSLHMPISTMMKACTYTEDSDRAIFIVPSSQKDQTPIIFGRIHSQISTSVVSDENLEPPQFFHYARPVSYNEKNGV